MGHRVVPHHLKNLGGEGVETPVVNRRSPLPHHPPLKGWWGGGGQTGVHTSNSRGGENG